MNVDALAAALEMNRKISRYQALIRAMDEAAPPADSTCDEPGITFSEAVSRSLRDEGHPLFQEDQPAFSF